MKRKNNSYCTHVSSTSGWLHQATKGWLSVLAVLVGFISITSHAQPVTPPDIQWEKSFEHPVRGRGTGYSVIQNSAGDYIMGGIVGTPLFGQTAVTRFLAKLTDPIGDTIWTKIHITSDMAPTNSSGDYIIKKVMQTPEGEYVLLVNDGAARPGILKVNANGNFQWIISVQAQRVTYFEDMLFTPDGGFIVVGSTQDDNFTPKIVPPTSSRYMASDVLVIKFNSFGDTAWTRCYGGSGTDNAYAIIPTSDGGYVIAGSTNSTQGHLNLTTSYGLVDGWVFKIDANGNMVARGRWGSTLDDMFKSIVPASDGGFVLAGTRNNDSWVIKVNDALVLQNEKTYGGTSSEEGNKISGTSDGGYVVVGSTQSTNGDVVSGIHGAQYDVWLYKLDASLNMVWEKAYGGTSIEFGYDVKQTSDGGYILTGVSYSNDGDVASHSNVLGSNLSPNAWVVKLGPDGALPVYFGSISATITNNQLTVDWEALAEINNDHYEVEVSTDGKTFKSIGVVKSKAPNGNSDTPLYYNLSAGTGVAVSILLPLAIMGISLSGGASRHLKIVMMLVMVGLLTMSIGCAKKDILTQKDASSVFVRIKQVDKDGSYSYSKLVKAVVK